MLLLSSSGTSSFLKLSLMETVASLRRRAWALHGRTMTGLRIVILSLISTLKSIAMLEKVFLRPMPRKRRTLRRPELHKRRIGIRNGISHQQIWLRTISKPSTRNILMERNLSTKLRYRLKPKIVNRLATLRPIETMRMVTHLHSKLATPMKSLLIIISTKRMEHSSLNLMLTKLPMLKQKKN